MSTKRRIEEAKGIIAKALTISKRPVIMFSGGKDSLVMAHIMRFEMGLVIEAIFHREPFMSEKYAHGENVLREWGVPFHDFPPVAVSLWEGNGFFAYTNHYQIGVDATGAPTTLDLPKNVLEPEPGKPWLCGVDSILKRPTAYFNYPWDMAFIGHKSVDEDQIAGKVPLKVDIVQNLRGPSAAFPLRHWSHDDVWDYIQANKLPVQLDRYDPIAREEREDKRPNGDYFHACVACIDRRNDTAVFCPKLNMQISNMSPQVRYSDLKLDYFGQ